MKRLKNTKPKAKPNGWEEEFDKKFDYRKYNQDDSFCTILDTHDYNPASPEQIKDFIHQAILSAEKETVKRCKTIIIDYFAGSGELWFPYLPNKKEEIMAVKGEIGDLLELLSKKRLSEAKEDERRTI